jgi:hypothetical protein
VDTPLPPRRSFSSQAAQAARQTTIVNTTMSQMADQKASILMGATFVVFTLAIGQASKGGHPAPPLVALAAFAFLAACFAVSVVMPSVRSRVPPRGHENLMFFGDISCFGEDEYVERMLDSLGSDEAMFRMMSRDIWQSAQVLYHKKYRLLGYAYRCFLIGLVLSGCLFVAGLAGVTWL